MNQLSIALGELGSFRNGANFKKDQMGSGDQTVINVKNLYSDTLRLKLSELDQVDLGETFRPSRDAVKKGDLFFVRSSVKRDGVGVVCVAKEDGLSATHCGFVIRFRPEDDRVDPAYLGYLFRSPEWRGAVINASGGATITNLSQTALSRLEIPCPPLETQQRIAAILGAYDDLIEVNRRRVAVLEEMARGLFEEWFVRFRFPGHEDVPIVDTPNGPLPEGWDWATLGDFLEERRDKAKPGEHLADRKYVPIECIGRRTLALSEHQSWENAKSSLQLFERGDLLFGAMRAYFHKVVPAPFPGITRTTCFVLRPRTKQQAAFALLALFQDATIAFAAAKSSGSTIPYAKWSGVLEEMAIPHPSEELLTSYNDNVWPMMELIMSLSSANEQLAASRDLLLPRLISGQLSVEAAERQLEDAA